MRRLALERLNEWYSDPNRKPLILCGARQVGKTYLLRNQFSKQFEDSIYIDLMKDRESREFFASTYDSGKYLEYIEARFNKKAGPSCPLILDEVQECPTAVAALKYFCEDHRDIPVIVSGSLVRLAIYEMEDRGGFSFPVGKVNMMYMYPLTFDEYLLNTNPALLEIIRKSYGAHAAMGPGYHAMAMDRLYEFLSIGGMPEAVDRFISTGSYVETAKVIDDIYGNYLADMGLYNISKETILKTRNVYRNVFAQMNKENKNFKVGAIERGRSNRDYFNAYRWLEMARIVYRSRKVEGRVDLPLTDKESGLFRYYLSDTGMFVHQSRVPRSDFLVKGKRCALSGIFYENYVADELRARGIDLYYWVGKGKNEMEFVVQNGPYAVPVDVKKTGGRMNSLDAFRTHNPRYTAVKISAGNYGYDPDRDLLSIPLYQTFLLAEQLSREDPIKPSLP